MKHTIRGTLVGQQRLSDVIVEDGEVVAIKRAGKSKPDIGSQHAVIAPTLFDTQVNGVKGIDLQADDVKPEDVRAVTDILAGWGVSHWVPTLVTGALKTMERNARVIAEALEDPVVRYAVPGVHLEGPYISPVDGPRGAHPKRYVRKPDLREFDRIMKAVDGKILYTTIAPEIDGAVPYIKGLVKRGVVASLGHHGAAADDIRRAVDAGARYCTHLGNGLASMIHRHQNPLWPQLADDRLSAGLIPDLHHLPAETLKTFIRAKGPERVVLTSDCVHVALLKPGLYELARAPVEVLPTGRVCLRGTDLLAGSSLMLLQGVVNAARVTDLSLEQAFACASTNPTKLFGVRHPFASAQTGKKAEFVVFEIRKTGKVAVNAVFVNGQRRK
ncbi:MAG TPA: amidohydrolase family protein [Candidatus Hydrogenedentes bacterium]|nr:amidohydrolase family protein [Candidatus Hydrogenedentota bacterium]HPG66918.1 amidohydrolase family protein [Candidatus Hydrogenedentota bacterium]